MLKCKKYQESNVFHNLGQFGGSVWSFLFTPGKTGVASSYHKMGMKERPIPVASVMLSADSEPLGRFIKQDSVTLVDITEALRIAANILSTLHKLGFCHGELSVDDIMIREVCSRMPLI